MALVGGLLHTVTDYLTSEAGGSFRISTRTHIGRARATSTQGACSYRRTGEEEEIHGGGEGESTSVECLFS